MKIPRFFDFKFPWLWFY